MSRKTHEVKYPNMEAERARYGLTMAQVAEATGVTPYVYRQTLKGEMPLTVDLLDRLCDLYSCDRDYLLQDGRRIHYGCSDAGYRPSTAQWE